MKKKREKMYQTQNYQSEAGRVGRKEHNLNPDKQEQKVRRESKDPRQGL